MRSIIQAVENKGQLSLHSGTADLHPYFIQYICKNRFLIMRHDAADLKSGYPDLDKFRKMKIVTHHSRALLRENLSFTGSFIIVSLRLVGSYK